MTMSATEVSLYELNQEITQIVKSYADNETSYFPNIQKVFQAFEGYLESLAPNEPIKKVFVRPQIDCFMFKEKVNMKFLAKVQRFIHLVINWDFGCNEEFRCLIKNKELKAKKEDPPFLSEVSAAEIIFLMYIGLEVERKDIIGKEVKIDQNRAFVLKQIVKILQEFYKTSEQKYEDLEKMWTFNSFVINEEKLIKMIQLKTLKLKLQKENFSFAPTFFKNSPKNSSKNIGESIDQIMKKKANEIEKNSSLVSVKSEFEESQVFGDKAQKLRKDLAVLPVKVEAERLGFRSKNFTNEEIFKNISLR